MVLPFKLSEYIARQERLFAELPESSVLIIPTNDRKIRSNDVSYPYRANSYMLYLCGWEEEEGVFVANNKSGNWETILFVSPRDTKKEIWEGKRIGVDGATTWPVNATDSIERAEPYISEYISDSHNIFTNTINPPNQDYFKTLWSRFKKVSNVLEDNQTLYSFRHSGAVDIFTRTKDLSKLQSVMGHASLSTSLIYLRGLEVTQLTLEDMPSL